MHSQHKILNMCYFITINISSVFKMNIMPSLLKSFGFFDDVLGFCFVFLVAPHGLWDLKFPEQGSTRDLTQVRDSESLCPNC